MKRLRRFNESFNTSLDEEDILPELLELSDIDFLDNVNISKDVKDNLVINISKRIIDQKVWDKVDDKWVERALNYTHKNLYSNIEKGSSEITKPRVYANSVSDKEEQLIYAVDEDSFRLVNTFDFEYCSYHISIKENMIMNPMTFHNDRVMSIQIEIKLYKKNPL